MAEKDRKVDIFAKPDSFLDKLKKRRKMYEEGKPEEGTKVMQDKGKKQKGY